MLACAALAAACRDEPAPKSSPPKPSTQGTIAAPKSAGTLADGIQFNQAGLPPFVRDISGMSVAESWGRWTVGPVATITFAEPLPREFDLVMYATASKPNVGEPIEVAIGGVTQTIKLDAEMGKGFNERRLTYKLPNPADRIELRIPKPTVPPPESGDGRALGIGLAILKIAAPAK